METANPLHEEPEHSINQLANSHGRDPLLRHPSSAIRHPPSVIRHPSSVIRVVSDFHMAPLQGRKPALRPHAECEQVCSFRRKKSGPRIPSQSSTNSLFSLLNLTCLFASKSRGHESGPPVQRGTNDNRKRRSPQLQRLNSPATLRNNKRHAHAI